MLGERGERRGQGTTCPQQDAVAIDVLDERLVPAGQIAIHEEGIDLAGRSMAIVRHTNRAREGETLRALT